ncbi:MAG: hypothetical protein AAGL89_10580 [Pseudomonadota bacterium]
MRTILTFFMTLLAGGVQAQTAFPCDWQARADAIVEPWEENSRTFANGEVRVAYLDVIEPAAASAYLLILHPPYHEVGGRTCTVVGLDEGLGYGGFIFSELEAEYDPATGLSITVPGFIYLPEESFQNSALIRTTINQATGDVTVSQKLGSE